MKKKLSLLILVLCMVLVCTACKNEEENGLKENAESTESPSGTAAPEKVEKVDLSTDPTTVDNVNALVTDVEGIELKDYLKSLGKYKGVEVEVLSTEVTDEDIKEEVDALLEQIPSYEEVEKETAQDKDYVNIDFVGVIDGKEFDGGSAKDTMLLLGSDSYIDGFEDGIIGMKKGETKDLKLKFPEDYHSSEYAGKDVIFTVTLNKIMKEVKSEYTDAFVKEHFSEDYKLNTVEDMNKYLETAITTQKKEQAENYKISQVLDKIVKDSEFKELPQQWINAYYADEYSYYESVAAYNNQSLETYLASYFLTVEQFRKDCLEYATQVVKEDIVLLNVVEAEKMEISDDEYAKEVNELFEQYSGYYEDVNEFVEANGGKAEVERKLLFVKARDFVVDNAVVTGTIDEIPSEDKKEESTESKDEDKKDEETKSE